MEHAANAVYPVECDSKLYLRQYSTYGDEWWLYITSKFHIIYI